MAGPGIVHVVLFEFKSKATDEQVKEACDRMLGLAQACVHPDTKAPYIKMSVGGKNNSIEGMEGGLTHGFVVNFENIEDRDYYVKKDPAHEAFVKSIGDIMASARVVDFEPGVF
ncbi:stress responsive A/B barrel domain protein [Venturia nashicola]|uniref:Stress responsive A/B barrel domain protein n=1 Tax=Venturia nashicola TaxID=86259 RepID=A0A4Z1P8C5_9PEZI|nr:stress responsive A/B barrel domain protein [Venturia nashicola]